MSYYQSNQPFNSSYQQKDGLANGAIIGGVIAGGAFVGVDKLRDREIKNIESLESDRDSKFEKWNKISHEKHQAAVNNHDLIGEYENYTNARNEELKEMNGASERKNKRLSKFDKWTGNIYNHEPSTKRKVASAIIGMGVGAIAGMGIDAMNKPG